MVVIQDGYWFLEAGEGEKAFKMVRNFALKDSQTMMGVSAENPSHIHIFKSWKKKNVIFDKPSRNWQWRTCRKQLTLATH